MQEQDLNLAYRFVNAQMRYLIEANELFTSLFELTLYEKNNLQFDDENTRKFTDIQIQLAELFDGFSGTYLPKANLDSKPLFLNMVPLNVQKIAKQLRLNIHPINLYTGFQRDGFLELPFKDPFSFKEDILPLSLFGKITGGNQAEIVLDHNASTLDNVYAGMQLVITSGSGAHQKALIVSYDGITKVALLNPALERVNHTSTYLIESQFKNEHIFSLDGSQSCPIAHHIFGADNYRTDLLNPYMPTFKPLTQEEANLRQEQKISEIDLSVYTEAENLARRKLHIFDCEFGNLLTKENVSRMFQQISLCLDQLKILILSQKNLISAMQTALPKEILNAEYQLF
ncbi:MAG: hypothetical protein K940chlam8_00096 [Chlamydiae bacterium]|nr:hypothetical protein [Chlamydiota bacterium]